jgi:release factor glutamine methyltransferase
LQIAKQNAIKHGMNNRIEFVECDLLPAQSKIQNQKSQIDLLCANLPYIPTKTLRRLSVFGREPTVALDGGADGLDLFRKLLNIAPDWLAPNALILLEIEATLGMPVLNLAYDMFSQAEIHLHQDLTGRDRLLEIRI